MDWISFYDFKHSVIYVNARHRDVHYRTIATDIAKLVPSPDARVMDYGRWPRPTRSQASTAARSCCAGSSKTRAR